MPKIAVRIPQIGEGLQEARLVAVLKQPGDRVTRDEPIYQMETDKAVMDVESPYEGTLVSWLAQPDEILAIGAEVATMEIAESEPAFETEVIDQAASALEPAQRAAIPPRTRAYAKEKGVSDSQLAELAAVTPKLMPADIDAYLERDSATPAETEYQDRQIPSKQRVLNTRLVRANQSVVPGTISVAVNWEPIEAARAKLKELGGEFQPSAFTMFAFAVAKAVREHPAFKTALVGDDTFRTYRGLSLGVAVSIPPDDLVLAVIENADDLPWRDFAAAARKQIELARTGKDQANEAVTLSLTNMQNFGLRDAVPVVVSPGVATLFLGEIYRALDVDSDQPKTFRACNLALTFDHRVMNGVGAANFIKAVKANVQSIQQLLGEDG